MTMERLLNFLFTLVLFSKIAFARAAYDTHKMDGAYSIAVDGKISATVLSKETDPSLIEEEAFLQLRYIIGQLNAKGAGAEIRKLKLLTETGDVTEGAYKSYQYEAHLFIAWPRAADIPFSFTAYLPSGGDQDLLQTFFDRYGFWECLKGDNTILGLDNHWYYYRPEKPTCDIPQLIGSDVTQAYLSLRRSAENTDGKYPEYGKVWEDGLMKAVVIITKHEADSDSPADLGTQAYRELLRELKAGPMNQTKVLKLSSWPSGANHQRALWKTAKGRVVVDLLLLDNLETITSDENFKRRFNELAKMADFVAYNGHAGFGNNVEHFLSLPEFVPGHWQLYMVNSCDSLSYMNGVLRNAVGSANQGEAPDKYIDIITNATASYYSDNARALMSVITALVETGKTYRQLLTEFAPRQHAVVTGEKDNAWPAPFL